MEENKTPNNEPNGGEKIFTQADVDAIIGKRLAEERAKFPTKEEIDGYRAYKASHQTDAEKMASITTERDTAQSDLKKANAEVERLKHERFLLSKGVSEEDIEYYDFKISKGVTSDKTYEAVAEDFIKEKQQSFVRVDMSGNMDGGTARNTANSMMNDIIRKGVKR